MEYGEGLQLKDANALNEKDDRGPDAPDGSEPLRYEVEHGIVGGLWRGGRRLEVMRSRDEVEVWGREMRLKLELEVGDRDSRLRQLGGALFIAMRGRFGGGGGL